MAAKPCKINQARIKRASVKGVANMVQELRASSMLFNPVTPTKNIIFTKMNIGLNRAAEAISPLIEASFERLRPLGQRERRLSSAVSGWRGYMGNLNATMRSMSDEHIRVRKMLSRIAQNTKQSREQFLRGTSAFGDNPVGTVVQTPFKILKAGDQWMFQREFGAQIEKLARNKVLRQSPHLTEAQIEDRVLRLLQADVKRAGEMTKKAAARARKTLDANDADFALQMRDKTREILRELTNQADPDSILMTARENAERAIFIQREAHLLDKMLDTLDAADSWGAVSAFLPFRRTPANEAREFLRATPLGVFSMVKKYDEALKLTGDKVAARAIAVDEISRMVTGTALMGGIMGAISYGAIEVNPFNRKDSPAQRATENAAGLRQDFIRVGSHQIPIRNLGPAGRAIVNIATAMEGAAGLREEGASAAEVWTDSLASLGKDLVVSVADEIFMDDAIQLWDAMQDDDLGKRYAARFGGSFVPKPLVDVPRLFKDQKILQSEAEDKSALAAALSGPTDRLGITGLPRLGLFGEELKRTGGAASVALGVESTEGDPLAQKMLEIGATHAEPSSPRIEGIDDQSDWNIRKAKGIKQREIVQRIVSRPGFENLPLERQKKLVDAAFSRASAIVNRKAKSRASKGMSLEVRDLLR